ncbi:hypothetical protein BT96DRAFT_718070 [Gymnopus androsaceus JB14]|uniref:Uncharacterized protein n=1 Tax=Gymnopus androsaceus JB14 TaxID=1447944 RepID=A0A6A4HPY4_9AGAR|nr:hypothetical protein BT96DRAFT_718070 [Gymnopus androsaceus JB14]
MIREMDSDYSSHSASLFNLVWFFRTPWFACGSFIIFLDVKIRPRVASHHFK